MNIKPLKKQYQDNLGSLKSGDLFRFVDTIDSIVYMVLSQDVDSSYLSYIGLHNGYIYNSPKTSPIIPVYGSFEETSK